MTQRQFPWVLALAILFALPGALFAQEATATGTITDSTGGVLPGVTVTATNEESGNTFVAVTDGAASTLIVTVAVSLGSKPFVAV